MGACGHHGTHQLNSPALGILLVQPFLCVLLFQRLERDGSCPERMLPAMCSLGAIGVPPRWLHLKLGLHSIFRLQGSRCFSELSTCHMSVTPSESYGSTSVHGREGQVDFHTLPFLPTVLCLSSFSTLLCNLKCTDKAPE